MIRVSNVCKQYQVWRSPASRLLVPIASRFIRPFFPVWYESFAEKRFQAIDALKSISFELEQGESLGIIGLNGCGKSTLLQIIAGTLTATSGTVEVSGRIAALLELGSGFDPEFTGRENVFLNGAILGMRRHEIEKRFDEIAEFSGIGEYIDRPVKTYSSGMMLRLAFSVQVHVEPDVLIVDEALSVGDARFQAKALNKIEEVLSRGTTLLFVGHDLNAVKAFCSRAMMMHEGELITQGIPDDVVTDYLLMVQQENSSDKKESPVIRHRDGFGVEGVGVIRAEFPGYGDHAALKFNESVQIELQVRTPIDILAPCLIVNLLDIRGLILTGRRIPVPHSAGVHILTIDLQCSFQKGVYRFRFSLVSAPSLEQTVLISKNDTDLSLEMVEDVREQFTGLFPVPIEHRWS